MANEQNLRPFTSDQSREAAKRNGSKGGKKTAANKKARKTFREGLLMVLNEKYTDKDGNTSEGTTQEAIIAGIIRRAMNGDAKAFELIRDTIGEKPAQEVMISPSFDALDDAFAALDGDAK